MTSHLPPFLMTSDPGSFARFTIAERKPQIITQVIEDNGYPPDILAALDVFRQEIAHGVVKPLHEDAIDADCWNEQATPYLGSSWLEIPWYFAETYFYRRMLEAVRYFQPGPWYLHDPFGRQKLAQEQAAVDWWRQNSDQLEGLAPEELFEILFHSCLWGNRADLSNYTVQEEVQAGAASRLEKDNILIDHTDQVAAHLATGVDEVDFVNDNAGRELLFDLVLAHFLLTEDWVGTIVLHVKDHPFFVSDAIPLDVRQTVTLLSDTALGLSLDVLIATGQLVIRSDPFWTSSHSFHHLPAPLAAELGQSDLVILKGDVNYRRLLDDRHWPHTSRLEEIAAYFPAPLVALRTLKGEIMVGLEPGQAQALAAQDPAWLINGKRGLIHYVNNLGRSDMASAPGLL